MIESFHLLESDSKSDQHAMILSCPFFWLKKMTNRPIKVVGVTSREIKTAETKKPKYGHTDKPRTEPLAGHVMFVSKTQKLDDIFGPVVEVDVETDPLPITGANYANFTRSKKNKSDWEAIEKGKWTIEEME